MVVCYISRTLIADKGGPRERLVTEKEIGAFKAPLVILGHPGLGKTKLTELACEQSRSGKGYRGHIL